MLCFGDLFLFSFFRLIITSFVTRCCFSCFCCCCCCVSRVCFALVLLASLLCARLRVISRTEWTNPPIVTSYATTRRTDDDGDCRFAIWFHLTHQHTHTNAQHTRTHSGVSKSNQHVSYVPKRLPYRKRIETHHIVSVFGVETFSSVELVTCSVSSICYLSLYLPFSHFVSLSLSRSHSNFLCCATRWTFASFYDIEPHSLPTDFDFEFVQMHFICGTRQLSPDTDTQIQIRMFRYKRQYCCTHHLVVV